YNAAFDARSDSNSRAIVGFDNDVPAGVMFEVLRLLQTRLDGAPFDDAESFARARGDEDSHGTLFERVERAPYSVVYADRFPEEVPAKLNRSMVAGTIRGADAEIYDCAANSNPDNLGGRVMVRFHVEMSGRVSSAEVITDEFRGTPVGECIRGVFLDMEFPRTRSDLQVNYPVVIE
ncbi:MAG: AgmX/PglI C-terminal domain-containing protein, partial [Myxococcota bacterium]